MKIHEGSEVLWLAFAAFVLVLFGVGAFSIYSASVQAGVYRRQGVEMTTWEVWLGAKPAERTINIKPEKP